ncbi:MAG: hypothetical protein Q7K21_06605, partial [Elusimicrobiota bacterium]|nr:hypothetical protein [Elusimicrobiota bacterium]
LKEPSRWPEILKFNNISADPNNVLPGMKLKIPVLLIREQLRSSTIISVTREVKMRRQAEMDWTDAKLNTKLYNKDGIRTLESSYTGIKSPAGNLMTIGPSSLVIIQPEEKSEETRLLSGEIRTSNIPIRTPTAFVVPKITPKTPIADYKTKVKEDQSTVVAVYKGAVDVTAKNKTITVPEGFSTEVKINLPPMEPKKLPPNIDFPADLVDQKIGSQINTQIKDIKQEVNVNEINLGGQLSKSALSSSWLDITHYHIQMAKDKNFVDMAYDEIKPIYEKFDVKKVNISEGKYFWRVAYLDSSGAEGIISSAKEIFIDKTPPALKIDAPADGTKFADKTIKIKGTAEVKSLVDINGAYVTIDTDGKFISDVSLIKGENVIKVNSKDPSGNISTVSIKVYQTTEGGITQKKKGFFSTPFGIVVSIVTISGLAIITIVTIGG